MKPKIIGIQGIQASTNERACAFFAKKYGWQNYEIHYLVSTERVLQALHNHQIEFGTFAWKSSRGGLVKETQEATRKYTFKKVDEVNIQIDHVLLANAPINQLEPVNIISHPQALQEHKTFL